MRLNVLSLIFCASSSLKMKVPTLFFCFLATLASLVFALPLQRRQFDTLQASQAKLDRDVAIFTNLVSDIGIVLDISISIQLVSYWLRIIVCRRMLISARVLFYVISSETIRIATLPSKYVVLTLISSLPADPSFTVL